MKSSFRKDSMLQVKALYLTAIKQKHISESNTEKINFNYKIVLK